jgi:hypothetical protein
VTPPKAEPAEPVDSPVLTKAEKPVDIKTGTPTETDAVNGATNVDPFTGQGLGADTMEVVEAWQTAEKRDEKQRCDLYLVAKHDNNVYLEVGFPQKTRQKHSLLDMLSLTYGGTSLHVAFQSPTNGIASYCFELQTESRLLEFVESMENIRELLMEDRIRQLEAISQAAVSELGRKLGQGAKGSELVAGLTTVTYLVSATRARTPVVSSMARTDHTSSDMKSEAVQPKPQRLTYTPDQLEDIRVQVASLQACVGPDTASTGRQSILKRTESLECVVMGGDERREGPTRNPSEAGRRKGGEVADSAGGGATSTALNRIRCNVTRNRDWLFQGGGTGL